MTEICLSFFLSSKSPAIGLLLAIRMWEKGSRVQPHRMPEEVVPAAVAVSMPLF